MTELHTKRLLLRPITMRDMQDVYDYSSTPNVGPNAGWKPHESLEETKQIMEALFVYQETIWGIVLKKAKKLIGTIGFMEDPKREYKKSRMLGYAIGESYWGHGYMTEAVQKVLEHGFSYLNLALISAYCYPHNHRSQHVLEKCHFQYEGTLTMCEQLYNDEIMDNMCFALTKQQYQNTIQ